MIIVMDTQAIKDESSALIEWQDGIGNLMTYLTCENNSYDFVSFLYVTALFKGIQYSSKLPRVFLNVKML